MSVTIRGTDTSAASPSFTGSDGDSGLYFPAANQLALATNGTSAVVVNSSQFVSISNAGASANAPLDITTPAASASAPMAYINPSTANNAAVLYINNTGTGSLYIGRASTGGTGAPGTMNASEQFMQSSGTQKMVLGTNSLRAIVMDSNGYVTTPYQVSFNAYASASLSGSQNPVVFNSTRHNKGSGYSTSTGRFTAPVDGTYFFSVTNNVQNAAGCDGILRKNGSNIIGVEYDYATNSNWMGLTATTILELVAGDYVDYYIGAGAAVTVEGTPWNNFVGYLLG